MDKEAISIPFLTIIKAVSMVASHRVCLRHILPSIDSQTIGELTCIDNPITMHQDHR